MCSAAWSADVWSFFIFGGLFKAAMPLLKKESKDLRTRGFKNGIKYCRRCRTRKKYQTGSKITIEINKRKLTPESGMAALKSPPKIMPSPCPL
jgi:hypothetical protein